MMTKALRLPLLALVAAFSVSAAACAPAAEDEDVGGDEASDGAEGEGSGDALTTERQLFGTELPVGTLSLTFDDGPGERTQELVEFLTAEGIEGTFFINGNRVPGRQRHLQSIVENGHLLANHTHRHQQLTRLDDATIVREVSETDRIIAEAQPDRPFLLRAPFGAWNGKVARAVNGSPMNKYVGSVFWDIGGALTRTAAADWDCWAKRVTAEQCGDLYIQESVAKRRGIVLFHDKHNATVDMVKYMVPKLKAQGFKFAKLEDVPAVKRALAAGPETDPTKCYSSTLGRIVDGGTCVQSRRDQQWYRCAAGDWATEASGVCSVRIAAN